MTGMIGCPAPASVKPALSMPARNRAALCSTRRRKLVAALEQVEHRSDGRRRDDRRKAVGEQVRPRALPQPVDDLGDGRDV